MSIVAKQLNVGVPTILKHLSDKGFKLDNNPNAKLNREQLDVLSKDFKAPYLLDSETPKKEEASISMPEKGKSAAEEAGILYFRESAKTPEKLADPVKEEPKKPEPETVVIETKLEGPKVIGKIDLNASKPQIVKIDEPAVAIVAPTPPVVEVEPIPKPKPVIVQAPPVVIEPVVVPEVTKVIVQEPVVLQTPPKPEIQEPIEAPVVVETPPVVVETPKQEFIAPPAESPKAQEAIKVVETVAIPEKPTVVEVAEKPKAQELPKEKAPIQEKAPFKKGEKRPPVEAINPEDAELIEAKGEQLRGLRVLGKIELPVEQPRWGSAEDRKNKKKRKRIRLNDEAEKKANPGGVAKPAVPAQGQGTRPQGTAQTQNNAPRSNNQTSSGTANTNTPNNNTNSTAPKRPAQQGTNSNSTGGNNNSGNNNNSNNNNNKRKSGNNNNNTARTEVSTKDVQSNIKATMSKIGTNAKQNFGADKRREKRKVRAERDEQRQLQENEEAKTLKVTEFISASELASMMDVSVNEVIATCMSMGMFVSINQRLDAEAITIIADEFSFDVQFVSAEEEIEAVLVEEEDKPEDLLERAPIVTIMGHVDHGKTSLLDYIRKEKVAAGEAGGITQHIGAYSVKTSTGKQVAFLDTPGHEAFTAMRARGAKVTDIVIIVIAADDAVMPQTEEAINHAQVAGVPIVFAFSKVDKPGANTEKIREQLSIKNMLVEEWGGKYQTQEISSKSGMGVNELLEKVLLEAEMLELKASANKRAVGTIIEASLDKGRGYLSTMLVQSGTLKVGDMMLAGAHYGKVKAMFDHTGKKVKEAGPSTPVQVLGLSGAPQAGDKVNVLSTDREAREIANKREQIMREQSLRVRKHITLEEIGRRKAIGTFKELNVIIKGDVDGSVEALSDSLLKLSTEEVQVRIIHKAVGQVSESDVLLASTADAVIVAFQVRPSVNARRLAEQEQIEVRTYSIIYQAIDDVKAAMEGLLAPTVEEINTANIEVRDVFKITKVGTVAGAYVLDGTVKRAHKIRVIRDFIVIHEGEISALKRFKDDVAEVKFGYECGLSIKNYHDLEVGDTIECYELKEVKRTLN